MIFAKLRKNLPKLWCSSPGFLGKLKKLQDIKEIALTFKLERDYTYITQHYLKPKNTMYSQTDPYPSACQSLIHSFLASRI